MLYLEPSYQKISEHLLSVKGNLICILGLMPHRDGILMTRKYFLDPKIFFKNLSVTKKCVFKLDLWECAEVFVWSRC